ncbi:cytochrome C oxidase assembly protein [Acidianus manzaensis]|uniref:Cytochrome C oxidase assembly protein n=1 Tax=Acidianus manzaensis TaxID=282676 RepID=A0A1W6K1B6_9CREN|nr:cytochrome C oxidase assembly protein [Acidianus manzaensis]ARM76234.1 cytochrome C oxidase assembly protein [Acidianus manzaensis]
MLLSQISLIGAIFAGITIVLGGIVEGYGYGLSLGTNWPYTRDILQTAAKKDPEAIHRISATIVGLISLAFLILRFSIITLAGFLGVVATALLGMATLYVLAGKLPSYFQGLHDIAAYSVFAVYLVIFLKGFNFNIISFFLYAVLPPHFLYFVIFMGGVVTGLRKMKFQIGNVTRPKNKIQYAWLIHGALAAIFIIALAIERLYLALGLTIIEAIVGLWVYDSSNRNASKPGISVGLHQLFSLLVVTALIIASV